MERTYTASADINNGLESVIVEYVGTKEELVAELIDYCNENTRSGLMSRWSVYTPCGNLVARGGKYTDGENYREK